ncbi:hypothetical protein AcW1_006932 [Taiwanofungus camphoratus]|nr:hypothetical protein AcW1_006932 [Antrodia cinnamomea]
MRIVDDPADVNRVIDDPSRTRQSQSGCVLQRLIFMLSQMDYRCTLHLESERGIEDVSHRQRDSLSIENWIQMEHSNAALRQTQPSLRAPRSSGMLYRKSPG